MGHIDTAIGRIVLGSSPCMTIRQEAQKAFVEAVQGFKNFTSSVDGLPEVCVIDPGTSPFILIAVWCQVTFLELDDRSVALDFSILYSPTLKLYRMCYVGSLLPLACRATQLLKRPFLVQVKNRIAQKQNSTSLPLRVSQRKS